MPSSVMVIACPAAIVITFACEVSAVCSRSRTENRTALSTVSLFRAATLSEDASDSDAVALSSLISAVAVSACEEWLAESFSEEYPQPGRQIVTAQVSNSVIIKNRFFLVA